jgi:radical SAM superfamily enzyme YgiQ (UPF0313 family)
VTFRVKTDTTTATHRTDDLVDARQPRAVHPAGSRARVLLTSVFGPYARDDQYGSRRINPMELYHNQVTRVQGAFSLRMFHRSWGLMLIQANIQAPCVLLDFPTLERFVDEIRVNAYDVVGISGIMPNFQKVKVMCDLVRRHLPEATIVVGGHVANVPNLAQRIDADYVVPGEGVRWFRRFLGEDTGKPVNHPLIHAPIGIRSAGIPARQRPGETAVALVPSVGCPMGCNFCCTSAMFGGKGKFIDFYPTGDELFDVMCKLDAALGTHSFFVMDENFLLHRRRTLRLLELMEEHDRSWSLYVFSSANAIVTYSIDQLVRLGVTWIWMGIEGQDSRYTKLSGVDTLELIRRLQSHGIRVLGSTIIGLEHHTPENIDHVIDYAVRHNADFHQFMLYMPAPGTPLHAEMSARGLMKDESECPPADAHGQYIFNYRHQHIGEGRETDLLLRAFHRDLEVNGPSMVRVVQTTLAGWRRYKNHPDPRVVRRFAWEVRAMATVYPAFVGACKRYYRKNPRLYVKMAAVLGELYREFGWRARLCSKLGGPYVLHKIRREEKRLAAGWTYEPPTFCDRNEACRDRPDAELCRHVTPTAPTRLAEDSQLAAEPLIAALSRSH